MNYFEIATRLMAKGYKLKAIRENEDLIKDIKETIYDYIHEMESSSRKAIIERVRSEEEQKDKSEDEVFHKCFNMAISKTEQYVLYRKYVQEGDCPEEANRKIAHMKVYLKQIVNKLLKENKSKEDIEKRFKEEFYKLVQIQR